MNFAPSTISINSEEKKTLNKLNIVDDLKITTRRIQHNIHKRMYKALLMIDSIDVRRKNDEPLM